MQMEIIIMYIYHALINALSAHMIHINLNMILYTHVEHHPTKTIYIKYYKNKNKCPTNTGTFPTFSGQPASLIHFPVSEDAILLVLAVCFVTRGCHWIVTIYINAQQGLDAKSINQTMGWGGRKTHVMATCLQPVQTIHSSHSSVWFESQQSKSHSLKYI